MAIRVGYFSDHFPGHKFYREGPFVIVNTAFSGVRIEQQMTGAKCPVLLNSSIYKLLKERRGRVTNTDIKTAEADCDFLNDLVRKREIVRINGSWEFVGDKNKKE